MSHGGRGIPEAFPPVARVPHINGGFSLQQKLLGPIFPSCFAHPKIGAQNHRRATAAVNDPDKMASINGLGTFRIRRGAEMALMWQTLAAITLPFENS